MKIGKLTNPELKECVLNIIKRRRHEVKVPSSLAQDCASFEIDDTILISSDPITGAEKQAGALAIKVNANDILAAGGEPVLATLTVLAPPNKNLEDIKEVMMSAEKQAEKYNLEIVGGHTEFTQAVNKIVVSATIIGRTKKHITADSAKAGDSIVITKSIGIEGTAILATDFEEKLKDFLSENELALAKDMSKHISIEKEATIAKKFPINAMHDITEGGIFGAVAEMAEASKVGAVIDVNSIEINPITQEICSVLGVDVYRLISSGSLIISAPNPAPLINELRKNGIQASVVGKFTKDEHIIADFGDRKENLETTSDELFEAIKRCK